MKKLIISLLSILLALGFCAHAQAHRGSNRRAHAHSQADAQAHAYAQADGEARRGEFPKHGYMKVLSNGGLYTPYENYEQSSIWLDDTGGFIHGDGIGFYNVLHGNEELASQLPRVPYDRGFELMLEPRCSVYRIDVYDPVSLERIAHRIKEAELRAMLAENEDGAIVSVFVSCKWRYVEAQEKYETWANSYNFFMEGQG